ncbi:MAG: type II toxin-antitoxin system RelE/ParE family toxin [Campylobacterota bacterium]|nr:type II toxin-antitoxin system RelE/ParE family toxin [Campylobacterota bacterium]
MKIKILFSPRATTRLEALADYIYERSHSKAITREYLKKLKEYTISTLTIFPHAGRQSDEIYPNSHKLVYQGYSIIYRYNQNEETITILTLYRENLP